MTPALFYVYYQIMTSGMISGDQNAVKRIFSLISRPLTDFKDLYYPSFAEWVSCKVCQLSFFILLSYIYLFNFLLCKAHLLNLGWKGCDQFVNIK